MVQNQIIMTNDKMTLDKQDMTIDIWLKRIRKNLKLTMIFHHSGSTKY